MVGVGRQKTSVVLAEEQDYVDGLFARIDEDVSKAQAALRDVMLRVDRCDPDPEDLIRRETEYHSLNAKLDTLALAQVGLVFGRIDLCPTPSEADGGTDPAASTAGSDPVYIGRLGIIDREDNYRTLLLDWRAPMARPFYLATTAHPESVVRRRHIRTKGRTVTDINDEILVADSSCLSDVDSSTVDLSIGGETALMRALSAARGTHMNSIVETIQREQDAIIRDPSRGVMVVQGGPGTGKTAVALHRVAYVLYTWREQLEKTGVLILGPNRRFLDYISRVLPELGETGVVLSTVGEMYPGVVPTIEDSLLTREIKGSEEMAYILSEAVKAYQVVPDEALEFRAADMNVRVDAAMVKRARTRARRSRKPHNHARSVFVDELCSLVARACAEDIGADPLGGNLLSAGDIAQLHDDLKADERFMDMCDTLWPVVTPERVLVDLLGSRERIAQVCAEYDEDTQTALYREGADETRWSSSDAALLDELAVLLGDAPTRGDAQKAAARTAVEEAQDALDVLRSSEHADLDDGFDAEILSAYDVIDAQALAARQEEQDVRSTAQRAVADREWAYGHVVVDEAQELTPMEWRMVFRRCPSRWMTLVGDADQTSSPAGMDAWSDIAELSGCRLRTHELTVNYRTPAAIMDVAERYGSATASQSIREGGMVVFYPEGTDPHCVKVGDGLVAVIDSSNVEQFKGLEFDHVIVVNPTQIAESPQGRNNLYVALTRATHSLHIIGELP